MCEKLEVSRSGFYAWLRRGPSLRWQHDDSLRRQIVEHFEESNGVYGSPRIHALLTRRGERVGRKRVARIMRELRLKARANRIYKRLPGAVTCRLGIGNEARTREVTGPDQVWRGDITYLKAADAWRYLAVVIDHTRVAFSAISSASSELTVADLTRAVARRKPGPGLVFHSDRGSEYGGYLYRDRLASSGIVQSMNRPKTMTDNAHVESFFHSLKAEAIRGQSFGNAIELDRAVRRYVSTESGQDPREAWWAVSRRGIGTVACRSTRSLGIVQMPPSLLRLLMLNRAGTRVGRVT